MSMPAPPHSPGPYGPPQQPSPYGGQQYPPHPQQHTSASVDLEQPARTTVKVRAEARQPIS
ncbi:MULTISPECIES: hypothetical protein [unclassified Streptomyces]|uniref:hypothetical protein n=1 Tax=unclassified Streptomyces TaxID=2593676 RepID=UPI003421C17F